MYPNLWRHNGRIVGFRHFGHNALHNGRSGLYGGSGSPGEDTPSFDLPLANMSSGVFTIAPRTALGSSTPTFTRATAATTIDFEGLLKTCLSGEVRCLGGRRVRNLIDKTESISADWSHSGAGSITAGATDPLGGTTAFTFTAGGANEEFYRVVAGAISIGDSVLSTAWVKRRTGSGTISLANASGGSFITIPVTSTWQRLSAGVATAGNTNALSDLKIVTSGDAVDFWHPQTENVTGQSNQNPSEYVSVGVLSAPTYHGVGVDGVKVFTTLNGNTVASNVVTEATGLSITSARAECAGGVTAGVVDAVGPVGYLAEGARANIALHSQDLSHAYWTALASGVTVTDNFAVAPDGTTTAAKFLNSNANAPHYTYNSGSPATRTASSKQATTIYAKFVDFQYITLQVDSGSGSYIQQGFDVQNGLVGTKTEVGGWTVSGTPTITAVGGGWYRCEVITQTGAGTNIVWALSVGGNGTLISVGDGVKYNLLWGFDNENNVAFASTYIPTTTVAVARNGDVLTYAAAGNINGATGSAYFEGMTYSTVGNGFSSIPLEFSTNGSLLYLNSSDARTVVNGYDGTTVVTKSGLSDISTAVRKRAMSWGSGGMSITGDGAATATSVFDGSLGSTSITIGASTGGTSQWFGPMRNIRLYPSEQNIQVLTV